MTYQPAPGMDDHHQRPATTATKPSSVSLAEKLMYAIAAITLLNGLLALLADRDDLRTSIQDQLEATGQAADSATVDAALQIGIIGGLISAVIGAVLWALMGWLSGKGKGWARIVATILGVLGVLSMVAGLAGTALLPGAATGVLPLVISVVLGLLALAVVVLLWRPDANAFFAARKGR